MRPVLERLGRGYTLVAANLLSAVLLLFALNLVASGVMKLQKRLQSERYERQLHPRDERKRAEREVYAALSPEEQDQLDSETWDDEPWQYEPWVGFRERPRSGSFVNVDPQGFRLSGRDGHSLDDPGLKVFVFGGSTTFGYNVPDTWTIPAHLQTILSRENPGRDIRVFNFGRAYYFSSQELALLVELLRQGHEPDIAIFIDGLNEGRTAPAYTAEMAELFRLQSEGGSWPALSQLLDRTPLSDLLRRLRGEDPFAEAGRSQDPVAMARQYESNKTMIQQLADAEGFEVYFYVQPVPGYRNDFLRHIFIDRGYVDEYDSFIEPKMKLLDATVDDLTSFSMTGLLEDYEGYAFVDGVHYGSEASGLIAEFIAETIRIPPAAAGSE